MRALILLLPSFFVFAFWGCIEEPNNIELQTISGTVYDSRGAPLPSLYVSSNKLSMYRTNYNGKFVLDNVSIPYNLFISTGSDFFTSYISIKNKSPMIVTGLGYSYPVRINVSVHFPQMWYYRYLLLKFISDDFHFQSDDFFPYYVGTNAIFDVSVLPGVFSVKGKLIYLECNGEHGLVTLYRKYGIKEVTLHINEPNEFTFTEDEINYDPEEKFIVITSVSPHGMHNGNTESHLYIDNIYNELILEHYTNNAQNTFTVPALPNLKYDIKILDEAEGSNWERSTKWIHLQPGENATIVHDACPSILTPINNSNGITDTTTFAVSDNEGRGIYLYSFGLLDSAGSGYSFAYDIYTDKNNFRFRDLAGNEFKVPPNLKFRWMVYKISNYNSIDELVSTPYVLDSRYTAIQNTKEFRFTTAP